MENNRETVDNQKVVEKALKSVTKKFRYKVNVIEEFKDLGKMTLNSLLGSLQAYEIILKDDEEEEVAQALQIPVSEPGAQFARSDDRGEEREQKLLLSCNTTVEAQHQMWTGCNNHMSGQEELFHSLYVTVRSEVKFGNSARLPMMGKRNIQITTTDGATNNIADIYYVSGLHQNLLSVGQLSEKGLELLSQKGTVYGLPTIRSPKTVCEPCVMAKQARQVFPLGQAQRALQSLELIHSDLCGPLESYESLEFKTPYEAWRGRVPNVQHLRVFGCLAYAHVPKELRNKLDDQTEKYGEWVWNEEEDNPLIFVLEGEPEAAPPMIEEEPSSPSVPSPSQEPQTSSVPSTSQEPQTSSVPSTSQEPQT
ncbi:hypothetical protein H6P81_017303 [Aristolochia fimbriata]|uniref:Retrovirus-related Pol polyprotein from transposon TNT 1-94-like beta-barrel domain-containing protein n=1 Tax=Aristolochia fimbriata TaxID=158543 RepID=A0AAV7DYS3_ARIFI|nr:hypothetical protein H6P81_017303 [Aristolochia fimbriata]